MPRIVFTDIETPFRTGARRRAAVQAILRVCLLVAASAAVPSARGQLVTTSLIARIGLRNRATSHYNEVIVNHNRWNFPDVFWFDAGRSSYREIGVGGGRELLHTPRLSFTENLYFDQASGPAAHSARFLVPWSQVIFTPNAHLRAEAVYFPEIPLNRAARIQHVLEREKMEYLFAHVKFGAGYGAYKYGERAWQQKPFLTTTLRGGNLGDLEFWLQRIPGNHVQAQVRYKISIRSGE